MPNELADQAGHWPDAQPAVPLLHFDRCGENNSIKPPNARVRLNLSLKSSLLCVVVAEVPETEAAVGRELDHRLCFHQTR